MMAPHDLPLRLEAERARVDAVKAFFSAFFARKGQVFARV